ncbi:MAG: surface carbohydrate biosynthesis protein [Pseudomonadota bacterium]
MSENRWLIIPVEVKHREFLSRIVLSALAASRGYRVLLGKDTMIRRLAPALPKGVIFDKSLGTARHGKPQRFRHLGHKVVVLDEESTGYYGSPEQFLSVRLADETLDSCKRWYCISDTLREHATSLYPKHEHRFMTSGLLRTDIWRKEFQGFYEVDSKRIHEQHGPFILFDSNFGGIIHARGDAFVQKQIRGQKKAYSNVEERMARIFAEGKPNLEAFIEVLPKLAEWYPKHRIIIRPHPSETVSFWEETFTGNERITVTNEGVSTPWILASDMMLHHGCTTGIEAEIMGKQHVMYAPHPDEHHDTEVMKAFAPIVKTEDDLKAHIGENLGKACERRMTKAKEAFFANLSGKLAAETILDDIDTLSFASGELPASLPVSVRLRLWFADNKKRSEKEKNYIKQKWPGSSTEEIKLELETAAKGLGIEGSFQVKEVFDEVWEIKPHLIEQTGKKLTTTTVS